MELASGKTNLRLPTEADECLQTEFNGLTLCFDAGCAHRFLHQGVVDRKTRPHEVASLGKLHTYPGRSVLAIRTTTSGPNLCPPTGAL